MPSFSYKYINVVFTLPSAGYMDKVCREMCHFLLRMQSRGTASVYRILKTPFEGWTFTPHLGSVYSEMPTQGLWREFERLRTEHQDRLYEESLKQAEAFEKRKTEKLEEALRPKQTTEDLLEKARLILPQLIDNTKATDQGRINVAEMRQLLKIPNNTAYNLRRELLKELHAKEDSTVSHSALS